MTPKISMSSLLIALAVTLTIFCYSMSSSEAVPVQKNQRCLVTLGALRLGEDVLPGILDDIARTIERLRDDGVTAPVEDIARFIIRNSPQALALRTAEELLPQVLERLNNLT